MSVEFATRLKRTVLCLAIVLVAWTAVFWIVDQVKYPCERHQNVSYSNLSRNTMDIYLPKNPQRKENVGAILFLYGSAWTGGDKEMYTDLAKEYACKGYVTTSINISYISEEISVWNNMDEITAAISKLETYCRDLGFNISSIALYGMSSGAHQLMLYSWACADQSPIELAFVVNLSGATDFQAATWKGESYDETYGPMLACYLNGISHIAQYEQEDGSLLLENIPEDKLAEIVKKVSPATYLTEVSIPIISGYAAPENDSILPSANRTVLINRLTTCGIQHEIIEYPESNHLLNSDKDASALLSSKVLEYCILYFGY